VTVSISGIPGSHNASVFLLQGPSIDSRDGVTFGGGAAGAGSYYPRPQMKLRITSGNGKLELQPYTAAYIEA
jgi:hypothetical protein